MINYFLQNDEEQMTISHLVNKMKEFMNSNDEPYSKKYMKLKLKEYFGKDVVIAEINGINDVVTLKLKANKITNNRR